MKDPAGAILHVWSHGWFVNMFEVASSDSKDHSVKFATEEHCKTPPRSATSLGVSWHGFNSSRLISSLWVFSDGWTHPKGGWQGGRGWEDTDHTPQTNEYFGGGGGWHLENFWEAMDEENVSARQLCLSLPFAAFPPCRLLHSWLPFVVKAVATIALITAFHHLSPPFIAVLLRSQEWFYDPALQKLCKPPANSIRHFMPLSIVFALNLWVF